MHTLKKYLLSLIPLCFLFFGSCEVIESEEGGDSDYIDSIAPAITILGSNPDTIDIGSVYTSPSAVAYDLNDGNISIINKNGVIEALTNGLDSVVYSAEDLAGNVGYATLYVYVKDSTSIIVPIDTIPPVITISGLNPLYLTQGSSYTQPTVIATDLEDGDITNNISISGTVNTDIVGTSLIIYSVMDNSGNRTSDTLVVIVSEIVLKDTIPPEIVLIGSEILEHLVNTPFIDPGAVAIDNIDDTVNVIALGLNIIDITQIGTFVVGYYAKDNVGNVSDTIVRLINIVETKFDAVPPVISISGDKPISISVGASEIKVVN